MHANTGYLVNESLIWILGVAQEIFENTQEFLLPSIKHIRVTVKKCLVILSLFKERLYRFKVKDRVVALIDGRGTPDLDVLFALSRTTEPVHTRTMGFFTIFADVARDEGDQVKPTAIGKG